MCVSPSAVPTHIADGDYVGPCLIVSCGDGTGGDCCFPGVLTDNTLSGDGNPGNELSVNISADANNQLTLGSDGALYAGPDGDGEPGNELQDLSLAGNTLSLSGDPTPVDLSPYLDNTDQQSLSINGNELSISNGNTVTLPDNGGDADWLKLDGNAPASILDDIYTNGKVGINTATPGSELEVQGLVGASRLTVGNTAVTNASKIHIAGTSNVDIRFDKTNGYVWNLLNDGSAMRLANMTDNETPLSILSSGTSVIDLPVTTNIGLDINGDNPSYIGMQLHNTSANGNNWNIRSAGTSSNVTNGSLVFDTGAATTERRFAITPNLEVGINYGLPEAQLHVRGQDNSSATSNLLLDNQLGNPLVSVKNDGKVGIGTASPLTSVHMVRDLAEIRFETANASQRIFRFYLGNGTIGQDNTMYWRHFNSGNGISLQQQGTVGIGNLANPSNQYTMQIRQGIGTTAPSEKPYRMK
ncbi:MAG: hypothetical protein KDD19_18100 [Phaeodactylibacter sp.]|nr:hypothetical protein [Phaeodactylibacter sp.]MCB9053474.1 hypothetical protein [Lewinellaceae bacterium]